MEMESDDVIMLEGWRAGQTVPLTSVMEFDHVIQSHGDGTVSEPDGMYAPDVNDDDIKQVNGRWTFDSETGWQFMLKPSGDSYTGQYGYRGPVMHPSEFIGGKMAWDIKARPGFYVAVAVTTYDTEEGCEFCNEPGEGGPCGEHDIIGWTVMFREDPDI